MRKASNRLFSCIQAVIPLLTIATISCNEVTASLPAGAILMDPPRVYKMWWGLTESCSGITADFSGVRWYQVPNVSEIVVGSNTVGGHWSPEGNSIAIAGKEVLDGQLVRHEMLHALTGASHTHEYFIDKCGGVVACVGPCLTEARDSPTPPNDALTIDVTDLAVESSVHESDASISTDSGWAALTITARNPRNEPVWVSLRTVAPSENASATFGYDFKCTSGGCSSGEEYNFVWDDKIGFAAGQTRRYVFDRQVEPGTYTLRQFFNIDTTASTTLKISAQ